MLSSLHPETAQHLKALPAGLLPFRNIKTGKLLIVIKATKEMILAARMNQGFKFYVAPLALTIGTVPALVTAFFDDGDEPLIVMTPLFDDEMPRDMRELLAYEELEVYFLDEHNREWMSYRARLKDGGSCFVDGTDLTFTQYSHHAMNLIYEGVARWFGKRTPEDDSRAITVSFVERIGPDDPFILDATDTGNDHLGSSGHSYRTLTRDDPGAFQERDIVTGLRRVFPGDKIAINPMRKDNRKEFVDVLVLASSHVLLVQAKDSPNTEVSLARSLYRKRLASRQQLKKGIKQAKGAVAHIRAHNPADLLISGRDMQLRIDDRALFSIVVIKETFADETELYVTCCRKMAADEVHGIVLDYPSLDLFTHRLRGESEFISGLEDFRALILRDGVYINPQLFLLDRLATSRR